MTVIEKHIHEHFASLTAEAPTEDGTNTEAQSHSNRVLPQPPPQILGVPFAKVNSVSAGGPAESAGLKPGDQIRNFGYVTHANNDGLRRVGECVQGNEGVSWYISARN